MGYIKVFTHRLQRRQQQRSRDHNKLNFLFKNKKDKLKIKQNGNKIFTHKTMTHYNANIYILRTYGVRNTIWSKNWLTILGTIFINPGISTAKLNYLCLTEI